MDAQKKSENADDARASSCGSIQEPSLKFCSSAGLISDISIATVASQSSQLRAEEPIESESESMRDELDFLFLPFDEHQDNNESRNLPFVIVVNDYEVELEEGLTTISQHYVHKNMFISGSNEEANSSPRLILKYVQRAERYHFNAILSFFTSLSFKKNTDSPTNFFIEARAGFAEGASCPKDLLSVDIVYVGKIDGIFPTFPFSAVFC